MDAILRQLAGSSLVLKDALTDSTGEFLSQSEAIKAVNGYLLETEERLSSLKREQANNAFKDLGELQGAQKKLREARDREELWREYDRFMKSEAAQQTNFPTYVRGKVVDTAFGDVNENEYWTKLEDEINGLVDGWWVSGAKLENALNNLALTAQEAVSNASGALDDAWQQMAEHLRAFAEGPQYTQLPAYFQQQMNAYFQAMIEGIDQGAEMTTDKLSQMAMSLKQRQEQLFEIARDPMLKNLFAQYDNMLAQSGPQELDALNGLVEQINAILDEKNKLLSQENQLPKLQLFDIQSLDDAQHQLYDATMLAEGLQKAYEKIAQANAAKAAEESYYSDQVAQLKDAFGAGDAAGLAQYVNKLNELYAANSEATEGMLKMFPVLGQIANGELEAADAVEAFNLMQLESAKTARERTAEMIEQAEADQRLTQ